MARNYNSASRVYQILDLARRQNGNDSALSAWMKTFEIHEDHPNRLIIEVIKMIGLLYDEVEKAQKEMVSTSISPEHYNPAFDSIFKALNVQAITNQWGSYGSMIGPPTLQVLGMCSDLTPSDGVPLNENELATIKKQLSDLRQEIENSDLPIDVKAFFFNHIELLLDALRKYPIQGGDAFMRAAADATILFRAGQVIIENNATNESFTEPLQRLLKVWGLIKEGTEHAQAAYLVYQAVKWVFDVVRPLLPPP